MTWCSGIRGEGSWRCVDVSETGGEVPGCCVSRTFLSILPAAGEAAVRAVRWGARACFSGNGEAASLA